MNLEKIKALLDMNFPLKLRDVQYLIGRVATLNRFIFKAMDKYTSFFKPIRKKTGDIWNEECEKVFHDLKVYMGRASLLSALMEGESLYVYLFVSEHAVSSTFIRQDQRIQ